MHEGWHCKRVLITVRTYPTPAQRGIEVSCTAGITADGKWIRLFPIPYRFLGEDKRFRKYQWIELNIKKAPDARPESFKPDLDSIQILSSISDWQARKQIVYPLRTHCLCCLKAERDANHVPTLGFFKPAAITGLVIEQDSPTWSDAELAKLRRHPMFGSVPAKELEKIPYKFSYRFKCDEAGCTGHEIQCADWEMAQAYREWRRNYGAEWEAKFRQRFETEMINKFDTHFYVGTIARHPATWIIIGLFYPPKKELAPKAFPLFT